MRVNFVAVALLPRRPTTAAVLAGLGSLLFPFPFIGDQFLISSPVRASTPVTVFEIIALITEMFILVQAMRVWHTTRGA